MYCKNCGKKIPARGKFCKFCGTKFTKNHIKKREKVSTPFTESWVFGLIFIITGLFIGYLLINTLDSDSNYNLASQPASSNDIFSDDSSFKRKYKDNFIDSCIRNGGQEDSIRILCSCTANYLVANYSAAQLSKFDREYELTGNYPQELLDALEICISDYPG